VGLSGGNDKEVARVSVHHSTFERGSVSLSAHLPHAVPASDSVRVRSVAQAGPVRSIRAWKDQGSSSTLRR